MAYVPLPANPLSQPAEKTTRLGLCICREKTFAFLSSHFIVVLLQGQIGHCPLRHWFLTNMTRGFGGPLCRDSVALRCFLGVYSKGAPWQSLIHTVIHTLSEGKGREVGGIFLFGDYDLQNQERTLSLNVRSPKKGPQFTKQLGCRKGFERGKSRLHSSDSGEKSEEAGGGGSSEQG